MLVYVINEHAIRKKRQPCNLDWAQSSWRRWMHIAFWWWLNPILSLGNKRALVDDDLNDLSPGDTCFALSNKVDNDHYNEWPGTWYVITRAFWKETLLVGFILFPYIVARVAQPLLLYKIVLYIGSQSSSDAYVGYLSAVGLAVCSATQTILHQQVFFRATRLGMRIRIALTVTIYKHLLTLNTACFQKTTAAQTINLLTNDTNKLEYAWLYLHYLWEAPLEALIAFGFIWQKIGLPTLFGYAVLAIFIPIQLIFSRQFSQCHKNTISFTDKRVQAFNEIVNGCQIIKMYNWEKAMEQRVCDMRRLEFLSILKTSRFRGINMGLCFASLPLISLATFGGNWLMGRELVAADIFVALAFFAMIRAPVTSALPAAVEKLSEARVAAKRIDAFMQIKTPFIEKKKEEEKTDGSVITMQDASFSWNDSPSLSVLNVQIEWCTLVGIQGAVGAGKSSLLAAILGDMTLVNGQLKQNFRSVSYASQSPWIFAGTIRANILIGAPMDEQRYTNIIQSCCLDADLCNFGEAGDLTIIGDKGINLSGGQKARVSLARALYVDADIYLLDDPLAAVDPKVAKTIFDRCIGPYSLLKDKTRLLVTHQTHFLVEAQQIICLRNGRIETEGSLDQLHNERQYSNIESKSAKSVAFSQDTEVDWTVADAETDVHSIVKIETSFDGAVNWSIWRRLFTSSPLGWFGLLLLIFVLLASEILFDATNRWLGNWSVRSYNQQRSSFHANIYLGLALSTLVMTVGGASLFFYIILHGSNYLHNKMLSGVLYTSLCFFASNPSGRILNRATKDQQVMDELLPVTLLDSIQCFLMTLGSLVIISIINPWVLILLIPLLPIFWWFRRFYLRSSRQLKRLESITRSPVYALFSSSLDGLSTIRAFNVKHHFVHTFMERIDTNSRAHFILIAAGRWFGLRLDLMTSLFTLVTAVLSVALRHQINPSDAALSLTYCINLTMLFQWAVRQSAEAENFMTSAERVHEYSRLLPEDDDHNKKGNLLIEPLKDWPTRGIIEFKSYTMRYRSELEPVLKNINLRIESTEKVGVIGRTGAGKSSLLQALLRLVDKSCITGNIFIDNIDIGCLSLNRLRSHLSVVPQVPVLFSGTLRYNLDPFGRFSDENCLMALEAVQLKQLVCNHADGLYRAVAESGINFSTGECQLICVARAILKKSKILLIDEAAANVDHKTDEIIQAVIADKFQDCTILTIAHRLNTVIDSDRILVLQQGQVIQFDEPDNINLRNFCK